MQSSIAVIAVIRKGDAILLGRKAPGTGPYPDTWHLIGGRVDLADETCDEAIVREIREETCLEVKGLRRVAWDEDVEPDKHGTPTRYVFLDYECAYADGEPKADDDLHTLEWVPVEKLGEYDLNCPTKRLLEKLGLL